MDGFFSNRRPYRSKANRYKSNQAILPFLGITGCMKNTVDEYFPISILIKNGIWKSPYQCPAILLVSFYIEFGHTTNCLNTGIYTAEKIFS